MSIVTQVFPLGQPPWPTLDPFLFCVHHLDRYPAGTPTLGPPRAQLAGRRIGMDFDGKDGWRMYHGDVVPGFPRHPHRGFETVTLARQGYIDHSDSLGATARFGHGDVQWMTAGAGCVHSEMFPLVNQDAENPTELFQIWLNLPRDAKMTAPHFTMFWSEDVPRLELRDDAGRLTKLVVVAGAVPGAPPPLAPPPGSWASRPEAHVAIWTLQLEPRASVVLPAADPSAERTFYFFAGRNLRVGERDVARGVGIRVRPGSEVPIVNGDAPAELLMLQGRPIGEPVAQHGPFVMNEPHELEQAFADYRRTGFGGWPWPSDAPVHPRERGRFAIHADGREEHRP